ncbi:MAG: site-specific recombinase Gcr [Segetibacter sp.]|nr:site-specific recombinase Gcr [Segetibacter sp.]
MGIFSRKERIYAIDQQNDPAPVIEIDAINRGLDYLVALVKQIRPSDPKDIKQAELKFKALFYQLQQDKKLLFSLRKAFLTQFINSDIVPALTESGMVGSRGFLQELLSKLKYKILPPLQRPNDLLYVINHVFYRHKDAIWVKGISQELWKNFFVLLGFEFDLTQGNLVKQLNQALHLLTQRTVTVGLEKEIINYAVYNEYRDYSFVHLDQAVQGYLKLYESGAADEEIMAGLKQVLFSLYQCKTTIEHIGEGRRNKGTSLSQTYLLFRLQQHLERLFLIVDVLYQENSFDIDRFINHFLKVVYYEKTKNSIREFLSANFSFIAYQITEHGGKRGAKYITTSRKEFWQMVRSAMGGGFIISFIAIIKTLLSKVAMAPFWQGFAYSVNYAFGFQLMQETNATLATKQPAYTASALASSLDMEKHNGVPDLYSVAITVARTVRSQLASFAGNLMVVFPLSFLLAMAYFYITGHYLLDAKEAHEALVKQHPLQSFSLIYACFTGFFLFASGLLAGYVDNSINYGRVGERLKNHPLFKNTLTPKKLDKVTKYVENNFGALVGNISLGFFLGMAGFFGEIFGIPFDIRHITISAATSAIAYFTPGRGDDSTFLATVLGGVLLIGLLNFLVSFACAFFVAIKSRGIRIRHYPQMISIILKFFRYYPKDFFLPPKQPRNVEAVKARIKYKQ